MNYWKPIISTVRRICGIASAVIWIGFLGIFAFLFLDLIIISSIEIHKVKKQICEGNVSNLAQCLNDRLRNKTQAEIHAFILENDKLEFCELHLRHRVSYSTGNPIEYTQKIECYYYKGGILSRLCVLPNPGFHIYYDENEKISEIQEYPYYSAKDPYSFPSLQAYKSGNCDMPHAYTRLYLAILDDDLARVRDILKSKIDINRPMKNGTTLHYAAALNHADLVKELLKAGAKVDTHINGTTPLHIAAAYGSIDAIRELIKAGADIYARDNDGYDAERYAIMHDHHEIVKLLKENGL